MLQTNGMEQLRIEEEMQRHRSSHNTLDHKHYANDDSRVHMYDLKSCDSSSTNRLSAPECSGVKKSPLSNSLTDLVPGTHAAWLFNVSTAPSAQSQNSPSIQMNN